MAVLTIFMTGAARRQAIDPAPPATMPKRPWVPESACLPSPGSWRVTLGDPP